MSEEERLRSRLAAKGGLLDVKFDLSNVAQATMDSVCREVNMLYDAVDAGLSTPLDFQDSHRGAALNEQVAG